MKLRCFGRMLERGKVREDGKKTRRDGFLFKFKKKKVSGAFEVPSGRGQL